MNPDDYGKGYAAGYSDGRLYGPRADRNVEKTSSNTLLISIHYPDGTHKTVRLPDDNANYTAIRTDRESGAIVYVTRIETTITPNAL